MSVAHGMTETTDGRQPLVSGARVSALTPFGVLVQAAPGGCDLRRIGGARLRDLVEQERLVVLRGFDPMSSDAMVAYVATLGEIYTWEFGALLNLVAAEEPKNYLFATGSVPLHWDGAFREEKPWLQFFQCVRAPHPGLGGETQFSDTTRVLEQATAEQRALWERTTIRYTTDKVAHYGGSFTQRIVAPHPRTGQPTLRMGLPNDEDTSPQNPVEVRVEGMAEDQSEAFLGALREILYRPEYCYTHSWCDGDYVIADNHALLHGRRAFSAHSPRHLQRVHVR